MPFKISCESTPNPNSLKFVASRPISKESLEIKDKLQAGRSPLAQKILGFPWAKSVFIGSNFISITKEEWVDWDILKSPLISLIERHLEDEQGLVLLPEKKLETSSQDSKEVKIIKEILKNEIQPAVAMDGGYIQFISYENFKVHLKLQGACRGCPSAGFTLKQGIETRLKQSLPEITEVISVE